MLMLPLLVDKSKSYPTSEEGETASAIAPLLVLRTYFALMLQGIVSSILLLLVDKEVSLASILPFIYPLLVCPFMLSA